MKYDKEDLDIQLKAIRSRLNKMEERYGSVEFKIIRKMIDEHQSRVQQIENRLMGIEEGLVRNKVIFDSHTAGVQNVYQEFKSMTQYLGSSHKKLDSKINKLIRNAEFLGRLSDEFEEVTDKLEQYTGLFSDIGDLSDAAKEIKDIIDNRK